MWNNWYFRIIYYNFILITWWFANDNWIVRLAKFNINFVALNYVFLKQIFYILKIKILFKPAYQVYFVGEERMTIWMSSKKIKDPNIW